MQRKTTSVLLIQPDPNDPALIRITRTLPF
jgi:hypothetical protein